MIKNQYRRLEMHENTLIHSQQTIPRRRMICSHQHMLKIKDIKRKNMKNIYKKRRRDIKARFDGISTSSKKLLQIHRDQGHRGIKSSSRRGMAIAEFLVAVKDT